ncbi:MAG: glycosyltransferase family 1 protein [Pseudomonadota bacterium]
MTDVKRILIATDAWYPQVNGVVRTLDNVCRELRGMGHEIRILSHEGKRTFSLPSYREIQLAWYSRAEIADVFNDFKPDHVHLATEGPIGLAVRRHCLKNRLDFTTGYHTRFAEYAQARLPVPGVMQLCYSFLKWFHRPSRAVLSPTPAVSRELEGRGFQRVVSWTRGVDHETFRDYGEKPPGDWQKPVMVYVGRLAVEKGIDDFLNLRNPGTKLVIGDGPNRAILEKRHPQAVFTGYLFGEELARKINCGDVFVFPSKTDTFGLVMIEAMACGLPVAAYPVTGPIDVVKNGFSGVLDDDLEKAVEGALQLGSADAITHAAGFTWKNTAQMLLDNLCSV